MSKNFGLDGIGAEVQLGKGGGHVGFDGTDIQFMDPANTDFLRVFIKDGSHESHAVTVKQLNAATAALSLDDFIAITGTPGSFAATVNVPVAAKIIGAKVVVTTAYNGTNPLLKIGTSATSSDNIDGGNLSDLAVTGSYEIPANTIIAGEATPIICTLSGTGTTLGAATVYVEWANDN